MEEPVASSLEGLRRRVSLMRLRYQADRWGLTWNSLVPWAMESQQTVATELEKLKDAPEDHDVDPSDLVPDYPSDWVSYDPEVTSIYFEHRHYFNLEDYKDFYASRYQPLNQRNVVDFQSLASRNSQSSEQTMSLGFHKENKVADMEHEDSESGEVDSETNHEQAELQREREEQQQKKKVASETGNSDGNVVAILPKKFAIYLETMKTLKDGGNAALKAGNLHLAARRYDKAIQYGSLFFLQKIVSMGSDWISIRKVLVETRLNMALLLLKPRFSELQVAERQALAALQDLAPFTNGSLDQHPCMTPESKNDFFNLESKAYFRLGSAEFEMGDYEHAVKSFEKSIKSKKQSSHPNPDQLVVRRLAEARREYVKRNQRQRKKFKLAFASTTSPLASMPPPASPASTVMAETWSTSANNDTTSCRVGDSTSTTSTEVVATNTKAPPVERTANSSGKGEGESLDSAMKKK